MNSEGPCGQAFRRATVLVASLGVAFSLMGAAIPAQAEVPPLGESSASQAATSPATEASAKPDDATPSASATESPSKSEEPKAAAAATESPVVEPSTTPSVTAEAVATGSIGGVAFEDIEGNGFLNYGADPSLAGAVVHLLDSTGEPAKDSGGALVATQVTDSAGKYNFTGLSAGSYLLKVTLPQGMKFTFRIPNPQLQTSSINDSGLSDLIELKAGEELNAYGVGGYVPATIGGRFFEDLNENGVQDAGEPAVAGGKLDLNYQFYGQAVDAERNPVPGRAADSAGNYGFGNLRSSKYSVIASAPGGYSFNSKVQGSGAQVLTESSAQIDRSVYSRTNIQDVNFALVKLEANPSAEISGTVYEDLNADGQWQLGEPGLVGVKAVLLDENSNPVQETTSRIEGRYMFDHLPGGIYRIKFVAPDGYSTQFTQPSPDGVTGELTIRPGSLNKKHDAGLTRLPAATARAADSTLNTSGELANTGAAGTITGFAVGGGLLVAGAASVFFARRRREA